MFSPTSVNLELSFNRYRDQSSLQMEWLGLLCTNWYVLDTTTLLGRLLDWKEILLQSKVRVLLVSVNMFSFSIQAFVETSESLAHSISYLIWPISSRALPLYLLLVIISYIGGTKTAYHWQQVLTISSMFNVSLWRNSWIDGERSRSKNTQGNLVNKFWSCYF